MRNAPTTAMQRIYSIQAHYLMQETIVIFFAVSLSYFLSICTASIHFNITRAYRLHVFCTSFAQVVNNKCCKRTIPRVHCTCCCASASVAGVPVFWWSAEAAPALLPVWESYILVLETLEENQVRGGGRGRTALVPAEIGAAVARCDAG